MKTISLKKVAAVAAASLAIGGFSSIAPANAGTVTAVITSISLAKSTTTPTQNVAMAVNFGAVIPAQSITAAESIRFQAAFTTIPVGGSTSIAGVRGLNGVTADITTAGSIPTYVQNAGGTSVVVAGGGLNLVVTAGTNTGNVTGGTVTASSSAGMGSFAFTPTKAGTYVMTVWHDGGTTPDGLLNGAEVSQTISIVVASAATYSNTLSTAFISYGAAATAPTSATTLEQGSVTAAKGTANSANIDLVMKNTSGGNYTSGAQVSAEIAGPGYLRWVDEANDATNCAENPTYATDIGRSLAARAVDAQSSLYVCADGTAGVATVTIKVTDADDSVSTLATRSLTFYGSVTKIAATGVLTIGRSAGAALGVATADRTAGVTPSIIVNATDKNGIGVSGLTFTLKSSNVNVMTETLTCNEDVKSAANVASSGGKGFYNCQTTSSSGSKSGDKGDLTVRIVDPAGDGTTFLTSVVAFTIGGGASTGTETIAFDKTSYAPGEAMVITRTGKDSSGNPVSDGTASPTYGFSKAAGGSAPAAGVYVKGVSATSTSAATSGIFAPVTPGSFTVIASAANGATITATATVTDGNAALLTQIDALNAKIVALNALIAKIMKKLGVK